MLDVICVDASCLLKYFHVRDTSVLTASYHAVHSKVVVLCLKLHGVRMAGPNLGVAVQKQALVVCDPVKHLPEQKGEPGITLETTGTGPGTGPNPDRATSFLPQPLRCSAPKILTSQKSAALNLQDLQENLI